MTTDDRSERRIALAAVAGAHGIKGELRLKLFTDRLDNLKQHERLYVAGTPRRLMDARLSGRTPIVRIEGVSDRNEAEGLRGALVEVDRSALPPLERGEYYHADLIGLAAVDGSGELVGRVVAVENYGAGDLLEIEHSAGKRSLIPFKPGIADLDDGHIVLDPAFLT